MADELESGPSKSHRKRQSGPKAEKKKSKKHSPEDASIQRNPKAFSFKSAVRASRQFRRKQDVETKKHHELLVDRTPLEPPPYIVAVVGPPKVGKTTLINSLLKNFTRQQLSDVKGPLTIVSGKKRRLTLLECNNDINSMIDVAKIADLVLLLIDASFGFEMEIFEFLNICQVHGFPKIIGVLTHLDLLKNNKTLKKTKKKLKSRFWTEVYQGAKLFYLSGLVYGSYPKVEVHNLGRFISVTKFRPLSWRTSHPYILADRMEELTDPEMIRKNHKCDRKVSLYGYVRGTYLKHNSRVHLIGCGDHKLEDISLLPDPCPLPNAEKKRSLNEKERLIYAPLSGVGGVVYDKDAVYIDLGGSQAAKELSHPSQVVVRPGNELVTSLIDTKHTIDSKMSTSHLTLFKDGIIISPDKVMENQDTTHPSEKTALKNDNLLRRNTVFYDASGSEGQDDDVDINDNDGKSNDNAVDDDDDDDVDDDDYGDDDDDDDYDDDDDDYDDGDDDDGDGDDGDDDGGDDGDDGDDDGDDDDDDGDDGSDDDDVDDDEEEEEDIGENKKEDRNEEITFNFKNCIPQPEKGVKRQLVTSSRNAVVDKAKNKRNITESNSGEHVEGKETQGGIQVEGNKIRNGNENLAEESESDTESEGGFLKVKRRKLHHCSEGVACTETVEKSHRKGKGEKTGKPKMKNRIKETLSPKNIDLSIEKACRKSNIKGKRFNEKNLHPDGENSTGNMRNVEDIEETESRDRSPVHTNRRQEEGSLRWKENLAQKAAEAFLRQQQQTPNLRKLVYGDVIHDAKQQTAEETVENEPLAGLFVVKSRKSSFRSTTIDEKDCSLELEHRPLRDWSQPEILQSIRDCFVTGNWKDSEDAEKLLQMDDQMSDESIFGDFEDLETGEVHRAADIENSEQEKHELSQGDDDQDSGDMMEKKKRKKAAFDAIYDEGDDTNYYDDLKAQMTEQAQLNQSEFQDLDDETRAQYEGFRPGLYVRVELSAMPCEFVTHFDARYPVILGGLLSSEDTMGFLQVRFKKHRWHKRILKTRDPLIMSVGWRRFQTLPMYSVQDHNGRHRLLKYTPEHLHCMATLFGPITPPGTGTLAIQATTGNMADFRISATGTILDLDKSVQLVKKLKLTGTPMKIFKNTAFIKGMFNSALEVAKFEGATIRTVSGIRGQVKRALKTPEGTFRATFEDKILISDIVFMRTWYPVTVPNFYNPVTSLLLAPDQKEKWRGMRTVSQLRRDLGLKAPVNHDSLYKPVERETRRFNPLVIPAKLQRELPFKSKPKLMKKRTKPSLETKRAVVMEPHEKSAYTLMQQLYTANKEKQRKRKEKLEERRKEYRAEEKKKNLKRQQRQRDERKKIFRMMGQAEKRRKKT